MSCLCRQAFARVRLLKVILNLSFIRDQRKELKAGVWDFQKRLQDWGGVGAASSRGGRSLSAASQAGGRAFPALDVGGRGGSPRKIRDLSIRRLLAQRWVCPWGWAVVSLGSY